MDWPEIRRLLAGPHFASLREVEFSPSGHVEWSTGFIQEKLGERSYALRIVPRDRPFFYGLHVFDT
ncbi:hypothetical protein C8J57DRAFT_1186588 [Mycena rebaudengoi]|nr:hypothetical protein C8J57DRAFT_1186588 [Mycena rebaudengoi]